MIKRPVTRTKWTNYTLDFLIIFYSEGLKLDELLCTTCTQQICETCHTESKHFYLTFSCFLESPPRSRVVRASFRFLTISAGDRGRLNNGMILAEAWKCLKIITSFWQSRRESLKQKHSIHILSFVIIIKVQGMKGRKQKHVLTAR